MLPLVVVVVYCKLRNLSGKLSREIRILRFLIMLNFTGNLPLNAQCEVCEEECGAQLGLSDKQCCWCQRCTHTGCLPNLAEVCFTLSEKVRIKVNNEKLINTVN